MKKYLPVLLAVACISPAQADTINLDLAGQVDMFHFSDRFIKNLQDCTPFTEQKKNLLPMKAKTKMKAWQRPIKSFPRPAR